MNNIDKTHTPPPTTVGTGSPPPDAATVSDVPLPYDTAGAPSPKVNKGDAPPLDHDPDGSFDIYSALDLSQTMAGSMSVDVFEVMKVMEKSMTANEKVAQDDAVEAALQVAVKLKSAARAMRSAAKFALAAGIAMGCMQIIGGIVSALGALKSTSVLSSDTTETGPADSPEPETTKPGEEAEDGESSTTVESTSQSSEADSTGRASDENEDANDQMETQEQHLEETVREGDRIPLGSEDTESTEMSSETDKADGVDEADSAKKKSQSKGGGNLMTYQKASNITTFAQGMSQITQGAGQIISTILKYYSDEKQAQSKDIEADAATARSIAEEKSKHADQIQSDADKVFDQMQQLTQSDYELLETITRV